MKPPDTSESPRAALSGKACDCRMNFNRVIAELAAIAFSDIRAVFDSNGHTLPLSEIPPRTRRAIASYKVRLRTYTHIGRDGKKVTETAESVSVSFYSRIPALDALGRYLGMFRERPAPNLELTLFTFEMPSKKTGRSR
jgi:phage terminase small subunit